MRRRAELGERPFGTLKCRAGYCHFDVFCSVSLAKPGLRPAANRPTAALHAGGDLSASYPITLNRPILRRPAPQVPAALPEGPGPQDL
jgi:hypothetical protein